MGAKQIVLVGCALLALSADGCRKAGRPEPPASVPLALVKMWPAPPSPRAEYRYREDGEGPFPASWPTFALVAKTRAQLEYASSFGNATLFLVSGPEVTADDEILTLVANACFADRCNLFSPVFADATTPPQPCWGAWVQMATDGAEEHFVLVDASGGTAGRRVRVYQHLIVFSGEFQDHSFREVLYEVSRLPVYVGDIDADGRDELLVATEETNSSGAAGTPQAYRVLKWSNTKQEMEEVGQLDASQVWDDPRVAVLCP